MPDFRNLILLRLAAYELLRAADPNLQNYCFLVAAAPLRQHPPKRLAAYSRASWRTLVRRTNKSVCVFTDHVTSRASLRLMTALMLSLPWMMSSAS